MKNSEFFVAFLQRGEPRIIKRGDDWVKVVSELPPIICIKRIEGGDMLD